jgi:hypothetical protein
MGKKSRVKKENPGRHADIVSYRGMGPTMEWFTDSNGKRFIINISKRMLNKGTYINQDVQEEVYRRLGKYIKDKINSRKENVDTNAQSVIDVTPNAENV